MVTTAGKVGPADGELCRRIVNYLHSRQVPGAEQLEVEASLGTILLRGRLPSKQAKRLCVDCCRRVAGVMHLIDQIEVPSPGRRPRHRRPA